MNEGLPCTNGSYDERAVQREESHLILSDITLWIEKKHYELKYYVIYFLIDYGCFRKYLHRFEHDTSPICSNCVDEEEDSNILPLI